MLILNFDEMMQAIILNPNIEKIIEKQRVEAEKKEAKILKSIKPR